MARQPWLACQPVVLDLMTCQALGHEQITMLFQEMVLHSKIGINQFASKIIHGPRHSLTASGTL